MMNNKTMFTFIFESEFSKITEENGKRFLPIRAINYESRGMFADANSVINTFKTQEYIPTGKMLALEVCIPENEHHLYLRHMGEVNSGSGWDACPARFEIVDSFIYEKK